MYINEKNRSIEMSKKFAKAACKFGTDEYNDLQIARRDYPGFKVVTITRQAPAKKDSYKGLTYEYMEKYIKAHDDENESIMNEYMDMRGLSDDAKAALADPLSYYEVKCWFLKKFPAIAEFHKKREDALAA